jgi:hypothetical protein
MRRMAQRHFANPLNLKTAVDRFASLGKPHEIYR